MTEVSAPLQEFLRRFCNVNALVMLDHLREHIRAGTVTADQIAPWRTALDEAIEAQSLTPEDFKRLTGDNEYLTNAEVAQRLRELSAEAFNVSRTPA